MGLQRIRFLLLCATLVPATASFAMAQGYAPFQSHPYQPSMYQSSVYQGEPQQGPSFQRPSQVVDYSNDGSFVQSSESGHARYFSEPPENVSLREQRAGLLGSNYVDEQYIIMSAPNFDVGNTDRVQGFRTSLNLSVPWISEQQDIVHQDVFISARHLGLGAQMPGVDVDIEVDHWAIGTTLFLEVNSFLRPFVQIGYEREQSQIDMQSGFASLQLKESDDLLLLIIGGEIDLSDNVALRLSFERDSLFMGELIAWLNPNFFLRLGLVGDFDSDSYGSILGGGVTF